MEDFFASHSLERCTSNPLIRCLSNVSTTSQEGGATFVPFGRGQEEYLSTTNNNTLDFDEINKILKEQKTAPTAPTPPPKTQFQALRKFQLPPPQTFIISPPKTTKTTKITKKAHKKPNLNRMNIQNIIKQNIPITDLLSHNLICKLLVDQNGSRFIQDKLTQNQDNKLISLVLNHIIFTHKQILNLSSDIFGNYVIQIFFDTGNKSHIKLLIDHLLTGNVAQLTHSLYGCRVIQKAFDCIPKSECIKLISEFAQLNNQQIKKCIIGPNSNHVIQKILTLDIDCKHFDFIIKCIHKNISFYSEHIFGCRIVQNLIKITRDDRVLLSIVNDDKLLLSLCKSEYGNYVIQDILNKKNGKMLAVVKGNIFSNILLLSKNKFGSNVVEKSLMIANKKDIDGLLNKLCRQKHKLVLVEMIEDKFANYVIQKLLMNSNHKQKSKLIYFIKKNIGNLKGLRYGKHIIDKIKKITKSEYYEYYY